MQYLSHSRVQDAKSALVPDRHSSSRFFQLPGPDPPYLILPFARKLALLYVLMKAAIVFLALCLPVLGDFAEGRRAYDRGDYATALKEFLPLAQEGNADAQFELAVMYALGLGVPQVDKEAVKWLNLAAEQGHATAQYNLGDMYERGRGVPQDYIKAHMWFNLAGAKGNVQAVKNRDIIAAKMTPAQIAEAQRLAREWKPKTSR